jgi:ribulose-phosphate 3-epimerase
MAILSPSILAADPANLGRDVQLIADTGCKWVHIDIMDGHFVPNMSFGPSTVKALNGIDGLVRDVHLMIETPIKYVDEFCKAGAHYLTVHVEADTEEKIHETLARIRANGVKPGIVVKPKTPAEAVKPFLTECEMILVMTVEPGFGGQKFMTDMMSKVSAIREMLDEVNPECHVEVDGGVDLTNVELCKASGADVLVAGSSYFKAADKASFVKEMEK